MGNSFLKIKDYIIDKNIFDVGLAHGCSPSDCIGECCCEGVYVSLDEQKKILEHKAEIKIHMDETQTTDHTVWFEDVHEPDNDFQGGLCVGTQVYNGKCVFLNKSKKCVLQTVSLTTGMEGQSLKPFYCITFPIVISDNVLTYDDMMNDKAPCCTIKKGLPVSILDACKAELIHLLGENNYNELINIKER